MIKKFIKGTKEKIKISTIIDLHNEMIGDV